MTMGVSETIKPHVAVLPSPGMGHVIPLLELAKRLVLQHGFRVSFLAVATTESSAAKDQLLGSPLLPPDLCVVQLPTVDVSAVTTSDMLVLTRLCVVIEHSLQSLSSVLVELGKPKALVVDLFSTGAFEICGELGIPVYSFFAPSATFFTFSLYLPTLDREIEGDLVDLPEPIRIPGSSSVRTEDLMDEIKRRNSNEYRLLLLHMSRLPLAAGVLLNSWKDLEPVSLRAIEENSFFQQIPIPPVYSVGPLVKQHETINESDTECLKWLNKQPPDSVLFVCFGSGGILKADQLTELAWGLELSQQRFLWVVKKPSGVSSSATFFNVDSDVNDSEAYLPEGFPNRIQGRGIVLKSWAPQVEVLRHESTGGFLSHCGWNSSLESIVNGIPIIAWPLYAEQRINATILVEEIGVAVKPVAGPGKTVVEREEIARVVRLMMEGDEGKALRGRVKELKESAVKELNCGSSSYESLCQVAKLWKAEFKD